MPRPLLVSLAVLAAAASALPSAPLTAQPAATPVRPAAQRPASASASARSATRLRFVVAPTGNEARYRVRELLVGRELENDVIGKTSSVSGRLVVEPNGTVIRDSSKIVVQVATLASDQTRRDNFLRRRTLESEKYPTVELVPFTFQGIAAPLAPGQTASFTLVGNLTMRGVTRPTTWQVTARADGSAVVGTAKTAFTFKDFELEQPKVPIVLSVADTVRLEYDFRFTPVP
jgi:polyisoprenoid-binding protein YceI